MLLHSLVYLLSNTCLGLPFFKQRITSNQHNQRYYWGHLVWLRRLVKHSGIDSCCHQVVGCCDGMNVTSQMEVELNRRRKTTKKQEWRTERVWKSTHWSSGWHQWNYSKMTWNSNRVIDSWFQLDRETYSGIFSPSLNETKYCKYVDILLRAMKTGALKSRCFHLTPPSPHGQRFVRQ